MEIEKFIENYREAFGEAAGLPVVFWYSDEETGHTEKIGGCFFKWYARGSCRQYD